MLVHIAWRGPGVSECLVRRKGNSKAEDFTRRGRQ